jgi:predicted regulator of Ras-like GTPase activity (Roadblock/LC7/MglB family)
MQTILASLKDIPGVVGSFVLNPQGALLAKEMPAVYPVAIFPEMGRRLVSVGEVLEQQTAAFQELLLKFEGSWLFVRRTTQCLLSVLVTETVNYPALRMATNVALRQLSDQMAAHPVMPIAAETAPEPESVAIVAAAPVAPAAPAKPRRMWRGQVVEW